MKIKVIGSGLFGAVCANEFSKDHEVDVIEERSHIGGNCYTEKLNDITIHKYGAHIFHTKNKSIWDYINQFCTFNNYVHKVYAKLDNQYYSLPFNFTTYQQVFETFGVPLPEDKIQTLKDMFIIPYSEKQWQRPFNEIPQEIINRIPLRYNCNNDYFENEYQGIPIGGYTQIFHKLLENSNVYLNTKFTLSDIDPNTIYIYTGCIDELFDYKFGKLDYRGLTFKNVHLDLDDFQFNSVVNYPQKGSQFTRILEHKHFEFNKCKGTWITYEYPSDEGKYYPVNDEKNNGLYNRYREYLNENYKNVYVGGRLGEYKYLNMDQVINNALGLVRKIYTR